MTKIIRRIPLWVRAIVIVVLFAVVPQAMFTALLVWIGWRFAVRHFAQ